MKAKQVSISPVQVGRDMPEGNSGTHWPWQLEREIQVGPQGDAELAPIAGAHGAGQSLAAILLLLLHNVVPASHGKLIFPRRLMPGGPATD